MANAEKMKQSQRRGIRLLLFLTIIHTLPAVWLMSVAGGTAPIIGLLAFGIASFFTFDSEGIGLGLFALIPALIYLILAWLLALLIEKALAHRTRAARLLLLATLTVTPLVAVYFPIYFAGGHGSSSSENLFDLFGAYLSLQACLTYWIALHVILVALYASQCVSVQSPQLVHMERWGSTALKFAVVILLGTIIYSNYSTVICRPLAELGNNTAQICVAKAGGLQARYWYERAAEHDNLDAIKWLIDNTPNRQIREGWLRKGAQAGDPQIQYELSQHLSRYGGTAVDTSAETEARKWLEAAAAGNYGPAQQQFVEPLTKEVLNSQSHSLLRKRNSLLEQAAKNGSPRARLQLAEYYTRGSMGYPADLAKAHALYEQLLTGATDPAQDRVFAMTGDSYEARLQQIDAWQAGLDSGDPQVIAEVARLYLTSPLPGPGVRQLGKSMFDEIAADDATARAELIVMLRTGTDGADKDPAAAKTWLLTAARDGEVEAMDRVASNYMKGSEGFPIDYPEARSWIEALIDHYQHINSADADRRVARLEKHLKYIDSLDELAGGSLLGSAALEQLAGNTDADAGYNYALQLLAVHGPKRRPEALSSLQSAAELGHAEAAWRLVQIYERGFPDEIDPTAAQRELERAAQHHHFYATRELAARYEYGNKGVKQNLPLAIEMYEQALAAGHDNRYDWNLDPQNYNHFPWLESRLKQAKFKLAAL